MEIRVHLKNPAIALPLLGFILFVFALGGGSRYDIISLPILRGGAALFIGLAVYRLYWRQLREHRLVFALLGELTTWGLLQLLPLPPAVWSALSGRGILFQAGELMGIEQPWRPISMAPWRTVNALVALLIPWAALLLAVQTELAGRRVVPGLFVLVALLSSILGILQMLGPDGGVLHFYRITNADAAVGLFSNRNHHAAYLAACLPLIALFAVARTETTSKSANRKATARKNTLKRLLGVPASARLLLTGLIFAVVAIGVLATGSRAGMLAAAGGTGAAFAIMQIELARTGEGRGKWWLRAAAFAVVAAALAAFAIFGQNEAAERIANLDQSDELRLQVWGPIAKLIPHYGWTGTGLGTFVEVYKVGEPELTIGSTYLNHAHNDWLEVVLTGGLPLLALLASALFGFVLAAAHGWFRKGPDLSDQPLARSSSAAIGVLLLFSLVDYPLRTPSIAAFFTIMAISLTQAVRRARPATEIVASAKG